MRPLRGAVTGALGVLLGLEALRTFLTGLVWMIGEALSPNYMGLIAIGVVSLGLFAGVVKAQLGRVRTERTTALALTALYLAALAVPDMALRTGLSASATMVWIWWFSAFVSDRWPLAAALVGGLSLDVAIHATLHGLDLPMIGPLSSAMLIGAAFVAAACAPAPEGTSLGWGILALGPWLFVQMEVLTNLARIRLVTGMGMHGTLFLAEIGLALTLLMMTRPMPGALRAALGLMASLFLLYPAGFPWLLGAQVGLGAALAGSLRPGVPRLWSPVAVLLLVGLFFIFYARSTWPLLPSLSAALLAVICLLVRYGAVIPAPRRAVAFPVLLGLAALAIAAGAPNSSPVTSLPPRNILRLMTYNIHQGLDVRSLPSPEQIVRVIEAQSPDIVALQEVNRGWTIAGNSDFVSWIERRLPGYHVIYGPMVGDLWGTVILSRLPVSRSGWEHFRPGQLFTSGFTWAEIALPVCDVLVVNAHLATGAEMGAERVDQVRELLSFWNNRPCTIIMGDANAEPSSDAIRILMEAGFTDWLGKYTQPRDRTWPADHPTESIDYIATTGEFEVLSAISIPVQASDHRPVVADVKREP